MAYISIGRTTTGNDIAIDTRHWNALTISLAFRDFSTRDLFDALLAIQSL